MDKEIIEGFLKDNPQGLSIQDLADKSGLNRQKVSNILAELKGEKVILLRDIGPARLHYWKTHIREDKK